MKPNIQELWSAGIYLAPVAEAVASSLGSGASLIFALETGAVALAELIAAKRKQEVDAANVAALDAFPNLAIDK